MQKAGATELQRPLGELWGAYRKEGSGEHSQTPRARPHVRTMVGQLQASHAPHPLLALKSVQVKAADTMAG
jgi:hypothetical protein